MFLLVVGLMAGHAVFGCGRIEEGLGAPRNVTARAGENAVISKEAEPSAQSRVVHGGPVPGVGDVAGGALRGVAASGVFPLEVC